MANKTEKEQEGVALECYVCRKALQGDAAANVDLFCFGCKRYVHETCDGRDPFAMGAHSADDHLQDGREED